MELEIISMTPQERMYSYSQSSQIEAQTGCIGHLRGDFGAGQEFFSSWFDHRGEYKTDEFKSLRKESKVVQTKKQYGDFSLTALSFASISIFSG